MNKKTSISIIIPAYNEAGNLETAVQGALQAVQQNQFTAFEILIVNDGSKDQTGKIAERLAKENPSIRVFNHPTNLGLGKAYQTGVQKAQYEYIAWVPGDNDVAHESLGKIFSHIGEADILIPYLTPERARIWIRRILSKLWTGFLNKLFGYHLKYYNGLCVYKSTIVKGIPVETSSFGVFAATLIRALRGGYSYREIPFRHQGRLYGKSHHFRPRNILGALLMVAKLFWEIRFRKKRA